MIPSLFENTNRILNILNNINSVGASTTPTSSKCSCNSSDCGFQFDTPQDVVARTKCLSSCVVARPCEKCKINLPNGSSESIMCFSCDQMNAPKCTCEDMGTGVYESRLDCESAEGKKCGWKDFYESKSKCCTGPIKCAVVCEGEIKPCKCLEDCEKESSQEDCEAKSGEKCKPFKCQSFFGQCCDDSDCWEPCTSDESLQPCSCDNSICRLYSTQDECEESEQYACVPATCEAGTETDCCRENSNCWEPCKNPTGQPCICGEGNCQDMFTTKEDCLANVAPKRCTQTGKCLGSSEDCCTENTCWQEAPECRCGDYGLLTKSECEAKAYPNFEKFCQKESIGRGAPDCNENTECYAFLKPTRLCSECLDTFDTMFECETKRASKFDASRWECKDGYSCNALDGQVISDCVGLTVNYSATVSFTFSTTITMTFPDCKCADCGGEGLEIFDSYTDCHNWLNQTGEWRWKKCKTFSCARSSAGFCIVNDRCATTEIKCDPPPPPGETCDNCKYSSNEFPYTADGLEECKKRAELTIGKKWECCYTCEKMSTASTEDSNNCMCYTLRKAQFGQDSQTECCTKCCNISDNQFFRTEGDCKNSRPTHCDSRLGLEWVCRPADCGGCCGDQGGCIIGLCQTPRQTCKNGCPTDPTLKDFDSCEAQRLSLPFPDNAECTERSCGVLPEAKCYFLNLTPSMTGTSCSCSDVNNKCLDKTECEVIASGPLCPAIAPNICVCKPTTTCNKNCRNGAPNPGNCVELAEVEVKCANFATDCIGYDGKAHDAASGTCERSKLDYQRRFPDAAFACEPCNQTAYAEGTQVEIKCERLFLKDQSNMCCVHGRNTGDRCWTISECSNEYRKACTNSCIGNRCMNGCRVSKRKKCPAVSGLEPCTGRYWDCATNETDGCDRCQDYKRCWVTVNVPGGTKGTCACDTHGTSGNICPASRPPC